MGTLIRLPRSLPEEPVGDPFLDLVEMMIMREVIGCFDDESVSLRGSAYDLAVVREAYLDSHAPEGCTLITDATAYLEYLTQALSTLTPLGRAHIRHPACSRQQAQQFLRRQR